MNKQILWTLGIVGLVSCSSSPKMTDDDLVANSDGTPSGITYSTIRGENGSYGVCKGKGHSSSKDFFTTGIPDALKEHCYVKNCVLPATPKGKPPKVTKKTKAVKPICSESGNIAVNTEYQDWQSRFDHETPHHLN